MVTVQWLLDLKTYLELINHVLKNGQHKQDRTGVGTISIFGWQMRFKLSNTIPVITTKKIHLKSVVEELLWFLSGSTNVKKLQKRGVSIWDEWADENGELGPIYGKQWRSWPEPKPNNPANSVDQISNLVNEIKTNPNSRRMVVSAWNVGQIPLMSLTPCHILFQFYVSEENLSCLVYQRSADIFLGVPFNITSYALLTFMLAQQCNLRTGELIWTGGDCHIYNNHLDQVKMQLSREPLPSPHLKFRRLPPDIFSYNYDDFEFQNYQYHPAIPAPVAV